MRDEVDDLRDKIAISIITYRQLVSNLRVIFHATGCDIARDVLMLHGGASV
ncbi:hypothetical protein DPMN_057441 [Dreissena polymorpha]|uniref:Uncharacterized protein n=1 Tax=Dreissena polymorpha TaxID=45954 RepID=A0A9D4C076_DREPO|nr:hypothetical protein DPMN_057441 [Dreissena polymorpha]